MSDVDDTVMNPSDLPKLVSRVSQCSTEWSTELLRMGGIYTLESARGQWGKHGWSPVSTLLWATFFSCVRHRGVTHRQGDSCKHKECAHFLPILFCGGSVIGENRVVFYCQIHLQNTVR